MTAWFTTTFRKPRLRACVNSLLELTSDAKVVIASLHFPYDFAANHNARRKKLRRYQHFGKQREAGTA